MTGLRAVVLAAGEGRRLAGPLPKVLVPVCGRPAVAWAVRAARRAGAERTIVVGGRHLPQLERALAEDGWLPADGAVGFAEQREPLGTGHALAAARDALGPGAPDDALLVLYGDCPLVRPEGLAALVAAHARARAAITVLTARVAEPRGYGRIVRGEGGALAAIVEEKDADATTRAVDEINTGVWVVRRQGLFERLARLGTDNAQGEYYLTDLVGLALADGEPVAAHEGRDAEDVLGFNDQAQLAAVRRIQRRRIVERHLAAGVEIVDPDTAFIDDQVVLEPGARVQPCTVIEGDVHVAAGCDVGPFARLRAGTRLAAGAKVGNFTETKKAVLGPRAKANHLTYLGDCEVGEGSNVGAGTITANYDGRDKHHTRIGARAFLGSGTVLVAPVEVGDGAATGAGAVVTRGARVGDGETWVGVPARPLARRRDDEPARDPTPRDPTR